MNVFPVCIDHWPGLYMVEVEALFRLEAIKGHEDHSGL